MDMITIYGRITLDPSHCKAWTNYHHGDNLQYLKKKKDESYIRECDEANARATNALERDDEAIREGQVAEVDQLRRIREEENLVGFGAARVRHAARLKRREEALAEAAKEANEEGRRAPRGEGGKGIGAGKDNDGPGGIAGGIVPPGRGIVNEISFDRITIEKEAEKAAAKKAEAKSSKKSKIAAASRGDLLESISSLAGELREDTTKEALGSAYELENKIREGGGFSPYKPLVSPPSTQPARPKARLLSNFINMPKVAATHQAPAGKKLLPTSPRVSRVAATNAAKAQRQGLSKEALMRAINRDNKKLFAEKEVEM